MLNAFHMVKGRRWNFCWVRFDEPPNQQPSIAATSPRLAKFGAKPLQHAILGLLEDCLGGGTPETIHHWVELIHDYVHAFARPWQCDDRLSQLWEKVAAHLDAKWNVDQLAQVAHVSSEHLRRLCNRELGRSPMHHVTFLRM